ncbi:MAG TPA: chromosome segregation protein SMC [Candidatus Eisenbacteria bacterium]|nr:chromosome segregation protein SMC [Candidatus Eisenbacteria bacterium]
MFLQRLDIQGFKSFPQRVRVDFGPGITAVVGPNGSGKTNIVEAIRWVLGEQNMRHLRGDTLEDVIFTGSAHRKPLGMAEVSLTMVNNRGVLPSEYTEVAIARRTFRSGQSEYLINRNPCRLRDVRDLFLDTGMGSHAYSLIERGMVDNVLSDESGHRRFLFEEAAGIMRYKTRKKEALQKLDLTHADLTRVNDITVEIEREVRSLARQVGKARRYGKLRDEIRGVDLGLAREAFDRLSREAGTLHQERHNAENRRSSLGGTLAHHEAELEELKLELLKREGEVRLAQEALSEHEARGAALLNDVAVLRERRLGLVEKLEHARSEADRLEKSVEEVRGHATRLDLDRARLLDEQALRETEERRLDEELSAMGPKLDERRAALAERKQLSLDLFEARVMQESSARNWREKLEDLGKRRGEIEAQRDALAKDEDLLRAGIRDIERALEETQGDVERGRERVERAVEAIARAEARIREHDDVEIKAREAHAGLEARHATLRELKERYEGYDASVRWLVAGPSRPPRVLGTVGDVLHASGDWLPALEAALGEAVQFVVAERTEAAVHALRALEQSGEGRATFISLDRLSRVHAAQISAEVLSAPGVLGPLLDHVRFEPGYVALASFLLSSVVVVDTIDAGLALNERFQGERLQFVTRRGERVVGPGIFQGGGGPTRAGSVLRREEELTDLSAEIERSAASLAAILKTTEGNRAERASAVSEQEEAARLLQVAEQAHRAQESRLAEQKIRGDAMVQASSSLASSLGAVAAELERALGEAESAQVALKSADEERGRVDAILAQEETEVRELERNREHRVALHAEARVEATRARSSLEAAIRERERLTRSADEAEREIGSRREEAIQTETRIQETETLCGERETELAQEIEKKAEREVLLQRARERFGEVKGQADDVESTTRDVRREHATLTERLHKAELEQAEADGELRRLLERVRNEYEIDLVSWAPEAEAVPGDSADPGDPALAEIEEGDVELEPDSPRVPDEAIVDRDDAASGSAPITAAATREEREARLRYLQEKLRSIGPVNLLAVQDYEERRQRLGFLNGQRKDLDDARQQLLEAIEKINATASELFLKTFEQVNKNFVQVFTTLFQGGEAALVLTGDDPLEAEIEILARPRGKKPQSLSLLSGGEKALTAIALLFAIYLEKPSPFCILDEVDAPLDDANIDRFVGLLRDFSAKTQFIVVTHNKKTMEVADALYGVTMQEPGVSKLVSVRWNRERQDVDQVDAPPEELAPAAS